MKILIIGSGGREHALGLALLKSRHNVSLFFAPGNPGTAQIGSNISVTELEFEKLLEFVRLEGIDLSIVGPEAPLVAGIVDVFHAKGFSIIGPNAQSAQIEGSKQWAKALMKKYHIPTASYEVFTDYESALGYLKALTVYPTVIKADGLASGKGVTVAHSLDEAETAIKECFLDQRFGNAGASVVIESFLKGEEASIFAFCDGKTILPMVPAQDHKAIYDGDKGPNTGGMGAYSPAPIASDEVQDKVLHRVFLPMLHAFQSEGIVYQGILYAGLMIDELGDPYVVEFNCRFGDPETQVVLPRLKTDLVDIFMAIVSQNLSDIHLQWSDDFVVAVVLASGGYPLDFKKGFEITGLSPELHADNVQLIQAGTSFLGDKVVTSGGRVMAVVARASDLKTAIDDAYRSVDQIEFTGKYHRRDIAFKAL